MNYLKKLLKFLGSLYFALFLISTSAILVIIGTLVESKTSSHLYASQWIYSHWLFTLLLSCYFINILFSALSRWPFKLKHIPFLTTHLGLLMLLSGTIIKNHFGLQGHLIALEGSGSHRVYMPHSYGLLVESQKGDKKIFSLANLAPQINEGLGLKWKIRHFTPHSSVRHEAWVHGQNGWILGLPPFAVEEWKSEEPIPYHEVPFLNTAWDVAFIKTDSSLGAQFSEKNPRLIVRDDKEGVKQLYLFDQYGRKYLKSYSSSKLESIFVYNQGFGGYSLHYPVPLAFMKNGKQVEEAVDWHLENELRALFEESLPDYLDLFKRTALDLHINAEKLFLKLLKFEDNNLMPLFDAMNWNQLPQEVKKAAFWLALLYDHIDHVEEGGLRNYLVKNGWPFIPQEYEESQLSNVVSAQLLAVLPSLPNAPEPSTAKGKLRLFKSLLKRDELTYERLKAELQRSLSEEELFKPLHEQIVIESPLQMKVKTEKPEVKLEENRPAILLEVSHREGKEKIPLAYDAHSSGLKWPVLNGSYLLRFQPYYVEIPYHLRLRQAREISYPNSEQPYSYEADILISGSGKNPMEITLSMNRVFETWDGYRFYLAGMSNTESGIKRVQIVVNRDPVKYWLTYPGAILVGMGAFMLFWFKKYFYRSENDI